MSARIRAERAPLMLIAVLSMASGAWLGLVRLGWALPLPWPDQLVSHGPLMVCGFLGTLIALERAVALGSPWGYAAPVLIALGGATLAVPMGSFAPVLVCAGSLIVVAIFGRLLRAHAAMYLITMASGGAAWAVGNALWMAGWPIFRVVHWWIAFLVLTIAGERLELNRVLRPSAAARASFAAISALTLAGVIIAIAKPPSGVRLLGAGLSALTVWLLRYDVARRAVRQRGVTRYIALGLLTGYAWLLCGGAIAIVSGVATTGLVYDAMLHAIFLGFVMSMVFAHAPVIVPAVLGRPLPYRPRFYVHLGVLHASVAVRILGDLVDTLGRWRYWGGMLNAVALIIFVINVVSSIASSAFAFDVAHQSRPQRTP